MQKKRNVTKTVAVAVAFTMALTMASGVEVDAAKKKPKLNQKTLKLQVGETATLKVVKNKNKISKVTWKSTKAKVAKVSQKGVVTAKKAGKADIKATFKVKGAKKKTTLKCSVTVTKASEVKPPIVGGWMAAEDLTITPEVTALFEQFKANDEGAKKLTITPYSVIATKSINGSAYRVLCRVDFDAKTSTFSILELIADDKGNYDKEQSGLVAYGDEFDPNNTEGGKYEWFEDPEIPAELREDFYNFFSEQGIAFPYVPIARIGHRTVDGKTEVSLLCQNEVLPENSGNIGSTETVGYFTIKMTLDENKKHVSVSPMIFPLSYVKTDYAVAGITGGIDAKEIETQAAWIRCYLVQALRDKDLTALQKIADLIQFPVRVDSDEYKTMDELKAALLMKTVSPDFVKSVLRAVPMQMWTSDMGIALGENIWLTQDTDGKIKIFAMDGVFTA